MQVINAPYIALTEIVSMYLRNSEMAYGNTKKAEEIADSRELGVRNAVVYAVTSILNEKRVERYGDTLGNAYMPAISETKVNNILVPAKGSWKSLASHRAQAEQTVLFGKTMEDLMALIRDESIEKQIEFARKERVLAGDEEPLVTDREWLEEAAGPARKALEKLNG